MQEPKTKPTKASVTKFLDSIADERQRRDAKAVCAMMKRVTGEKPVMWGPSIVGFGLFHYRSKSCEGDWPVSSFSPRKGYTAVYIMAGFDGYPALMKKLGRCKTGKSCLQVKSLDDVDTVVLEELVRRSVAWMKERYK